MCAVSYVGDYWTSSLPQRYPNYQQPGIYWNPVTQEQFEALRKEIAELKELLLAAKKFDDATGQPHCEQEEKVALIKNIAKMVGIDMKDIFPENSD